MVFKNKFRFLGWIKLLAILSQHQDIRVAAPAQRALLNYDEDDTSDGKRLKFYRKIYQLYPKQRRKGSPKIDVIFIHGLLGGVFITWRQRDTGNCGHKSPLELLGTYKELKKNSFFQSVLLSRKFELMQNFIFQPDCFYISFL